MVKWLLASVLMLRDATGDRYRGRELLAQLRELFVQQRILLAEVPVLDLYLGREQVSGGDRDGGIPVIRKSVDAMSTRGQIGYWIAAAGVLVETSLDRSAEGDVAEAEAAIARLTAAPAEGSVIRDIWLMRLRALLAQANGDETSYRNQSGPLSCICDIIGLRRTYGLGRGNAMTARLVRR